MYGKYYIITYSNIQDLVHLLLQIIVGKCSDM